jgi:pimeloyl-ACP methyl ester carboxylesterase
MTGIAYRPADVDGLTVFYREAGASDAPALVLLHGFPSASPLLAVRGRIDPLFLPAGAEASKRDLPDADVRFFDTGHFALETHVNEIATAIREFPSR